MIEAASTSASFEIMVVKQDTPDGEEKYPFLLDDGSESIALATDAGSAPRLHDAETTTTTTTIPATTTEPRPASKGRVNDRFLMNLVRGAEGHNAALLRREREEKLGLRRHPLVNTLRAIERRKLEDSRRENRGEHGGRVRRQGRTRSQSPPPPTPPSREEDRCRRDERRRPRSRESSGPSLRGRGQASSAVLDVDLSLLAGEAKGEGDGKTVADAEDDWAESRASREAQRQYRLATSAERDGIPPWTTREEMDASGRAWTTLLKTPKTVVIEEDDNGKWKCGAGYL